MELIHDLLNYHSPMSTEEMVKYFNRSGHKKALILPFYHWADVDYPVLKSSHIRDNKSLYVCTNSFEWNPQGIPGRHLYRIDAVIRNPLLLMQQYSDYELVFNRGHKIRAHSQIQYPDFDTIIHPPHSLNQKASQVCLLKPKEQILMIQSLGIMD